MDSLFDDQWSATIRIEKINYITKFSEIFNEKSFQIVFKRSRPIFIEKLLRKWFFVFADQWSKVYITEK